MTEITGQTPPPPDPLINTRADLSILNLDTEAQVKIESGRNAFLFGVYMEPMIKAGLRHVSDGSIGKDDVTLALQATADLFAASGKDYETQRDKTGQPIHLEGVALSVHQRNVLNGDIVLVPAENELNEKNRLVQLQRSDATFSNLPPGIQAVIAELNYEAFFRPATMAGGERTRDRGERERLLTSLGKDQEAMPHLTLTNWAIADVVKGVAEFAAQTNKKVRVVDTGSGPGGTLSAITSRLADAEALPKDLAVSGIETTQGFYDQLDDFIAGDQVIRDLGLDVNPIAKNDGLPVSEPGYLTIVKADTLSGLKRLHEQGFSDDEVVVITGNYSWHRLTTEVKKEIMELYKDAPNVIFAIGDFANHGNPVAKQYFCLGANGPLNVGNLDLENKFRESGYSIVELESEKPQALDQRFNDQIVADDRNPDSDGHLWIAHRGDLAKETLQLKAA